MRDSWESWVPNLHANLVFIVQNGSVLLIHKKRGLGAGKLNGPGGKLEPGETAMEAAVREAQEELCITPLDLLELGLLHFDFTDGLKLHCTVFRGESFDGTPTETEEARPEWFGIDAIPFDRMWADDIHWLPGLIAGRKFSAWFEFDGETMLSRRIDWINAPDQ